MANEMLLKTARELLELNWNMQAVGTLAPVVEFVESAIAGFVPDIEEEEESELRGLILRNLNVYRQQKMPVECKRMFDLIANLHLAICIYEGVSDDILKDAILHFHNQRMNAYARYVEMITKGDMSA